MELESVVEKIVSYPFASGKHLVSMMITGIALGTYLIAAVDTGTLNPVEIVKRRKEVLNRNAREKAQYDTLFRVATKLADGNHNGLSLAEKAELWERMGYTISASTADDKEMQEIFPVPTTADLERAVTSYQR